MQSKKKREHAAVNDRFEEVLRQVVATAYFEKPHKFSKRHLRQMHRLFHGNQVLPIGALVGMLLCIMIAVVAVCMSSHYKYKKDK